VNSGVPDVRLYCVFARDLKYQSFSVAARVGDGPFNDCALHRHLFDCVAVDERQNFIEDSTVSPTFTIPRFDFQPLRPV